MGLHYDEEKTFRFLLFKGTHFANFPHFVLGGLPNPPEP